MFIAGRGNLMPYIGSTWNPIGFHPDDDDWLAKQRRLALALVASTGQLVLASFLTKAEHRQVRLQAEK